MIIKFLLYLSRKWHEFKDAKDPNIKVRTDWIYNKKGDNRIDT